jgi:hypothetical protein
MQNYNEQESSIFDETFENLLDIETEELLTNPLCCDFGHKLFAQTEPTTTNNCDCCQATGIEAHGTFYRCESCDFDMCQACIAEKMCGEEAGLSICTRLMQLVSNQQYEEALDDITIEDVLAYAQAINEGLEAAFEDHGVTQEVEEEPVEDLQSETDHTDLIQATEYKDDYQSVPEMPEASEEDSEGENESEDSQEESSDENQDEQLHDENDTTEVD